MDHRNTQFTGPMIDRQTDPQGHSHMLTDPRVFFGNAPNFPQPNIHPFVPAIGNHCNFNFHHTPEHLDGTLFYGMPPYSSVPPQHPPLNLDLAVAAPSSHYNPYLRRPSSSRDFPVRINPSVHDPLSLSSNPVVGIPMDRGLFKRNIIEGTPASNLDYNPSGASSSSSGMIGRSGESDITPMDVALFTPSEYGGNDSAVSMVSPEPVMVHNANHLIRGNYVSPPIPLPGNPWLDMHFGPNNNNISGFTWTQAPDLSHVRAGVNGACVEMGNMGSQGFRSSNGFLHPQGYHNPRHQPPLQGVRGYNNFPPQMASNPHRISMASASNSTINPFQDGLQTAFRFYQPYQREITRDSNARRSNLLQLRVLPEDEIAMLEIPGYLESGDPIDHHGDMRLDIDHMSYEELLALGEQIGSAGTGFTVEFIDNKLKTRTFSSSTTCFNLEEEASIDGHINFCVICQSDYEDGEIIGMPDCGHEYHQECIKKWLLVKNACPVCKSTALNSKGKACK